LEIVGGISNSGTVSGTITTGYSGTITDPYSSIPVPTASDYSTAAVPTVTSGSITCGSGGGSACTVNSNSVVTLQPGRYTSAVTFSSKTTINLVSGGVYYFEGGISINSNAQVNGTNVLLINGGSGALNIASNSGLNITPPSSGTYQGFSIYQPSTNTSTLQINSNSGGQIGGVIYAPNAPAVVSSNGALVLKGETNVFKNLTLNSSASLTVTPTSSTSMALN